MKRLIIIGAGGLGREIRGFADAVEVAGAPWTFTGFLDDRPNIIDGKNCKGTVIGSPQSYEPRPDDLFVCGIMDPRLRKHYVELIAARGGQFTNIIHPSCSVSFGGGWGVGNVFGLSVAISTNVHVGSHCILNSFASIGHDTILGDYVSVHNRALVSGGLRIPRFVELGANSTVVQRARLDEGAKLGAGSVLIGHAPAAVLMMGVPAKRWLG